MNLPSERIKPKGFLTLDDVCFELDALHDRIKALENQIPPTYCHLVYPYEKHDYVEPKKEPKCEHDIGSTWQKRMDDRSYDIFEKDQCVSCPFCKPANSSPQEKTRQAKCESWLVVNGQYVECTWDKEHIGCHSTWIKGEKIKWSK